MVIPLIMTGAGLTLYSVFGWRYKEARMVQRAIRQRGLCEKDGLGRPRPWKLAGQVRTKDALVMHFLIPPGLSYAELVSDDSPRCIMPALWELFGEAQVWHPAPGIFSMHIPRRVETLAHT